MNTSATTLHGTYEGLLTLRTDGRFDVRDSDTANRLYGCPLDPHCILSTAHHGPCDHQRQTDLARGEQPIFHLCPDGDALYRTHDTWILIPADPATPLQASNPHPMRLFIPADHLPVLATLIRDNGTPHNLEQLPTVLADKLIPDRTLHIELQNMPHLQAARDHMAQTILDAAPLP